MKVHEFTLVLSADPTEEEADRLYGVFNDGTISTVAGVAQISFAREANSLEAAIGAAIRDVRTAGFALVIERIELEPVAVATV